jgi:hypothetical protein
MPNVDDVIKDIDRTKLDRMWYASPALRKVLDVFERNERWVTTTHASDIEELRQKVNEIYPKAKGKRSETNEFRDTTLSWCVRQLRSRGFLHRTRVAPGLNFYGFKEAIEELEDAVRASHAS